MADALVEKGGRERGRMDDVEDKALRASAAI